MKKVLIDRHWSQQLDMNSGWDEIYPAVWAYVCIATHYHSRAWPQPAHCHGWHIFAYGARPQKTWFISKKKYKC